MGFLFAPKVTVVISGALLKKVLSPSPPKAGVESTYSELTDPEHEQRLRGIRAQAGKYSHLGEDVYREIRQRLRSGSKASEIASAVGCGESTVYRVRKQMKDEGGELWAA